MFRRSTDTAFRPYVFSDVYDASSLIVVSAGSTSLSAEYNPQQMHRISNRNAGAGVDLVAGWESNYQFSAGGWDVRLSIDLTAIPQRSRGGRIKVIAAGEASSGYGYYDTDQLGYTYYRDHNGSWVNLAGPYGTDDEKQDAGFDGDLNFTTTASVQDYINNVGGTLQIRQLHTGSSNTNSWFANGETYDEYRISSIEIIGF